MSPELSEALALIFDDVDAISSILKMEGDFVGALSLQLLVLAELRGIRAELVRANDTCDDTRDTLKAAAARLDGGALISAGF